MAFCRACGQDAGESSFCPKCGAPQGGSPSASQSSPQSAPHGAVVSAPAAASPTEGIDENVAGLLCYLFGWVSGLIFLLIDKRPFVKFHAAQTIALSLSVGVVMIGYWMFSFFVTIITAAMHFPIGILSFFLLPVIMLAFLATFIFCMYKAYSHEKFKLPIIGNIVEKMVAQ